MCYPVNSFLADRTELTVELMARLSSVRLSQMYCG